MNFVFFVSHVNPLRIQVVRVLGIQRNEGHGQWDCRSSQRLSIRHSGEVGGCVKGFFQD